MSKKGVFHLDTTYLFGSVQDGLEKHCQNYTQLPCHIPGEIRCAKQGLHGIATLILPKEMGLSHRRARAQGVPQVLVCLHGVMPMASHGGLVRSSVKCIQIIQSEAWTVIDMHPS